MMNQYIDHTLLKPEATLEQIEVLCQEAKEYHFKSVCVNPFYVATCADLLKDSDVEVCTVIGFPLGSNTQETKVFEAQNALNNGATELDMVLNIGALKDGNDAYVEAEIHALKETAGDKVLKVILETCLLSDVEIVRACKAAKRAGADFVKTSTGFSTGGATVEAVKLMKETVGNDVEVKASGGVRSYEDMVAMVEAGATRIGTSSGIQLMKREKAEGNY